MQKLILSLKEFSSHPLVPRIDLSTIIFQTLTDFHIVIPPLQFQMMFKECKNWDEKFERLLENVSEHPKFSKSNLRVIVDGFYRTLRNILLYEENFGKLNSNATLILSTIKVLPFPDDFIVQTVRAVFSPKGQTL